jgi:hypothetical protein
MLIVLNDYVYTVSRVHLKHKRLMSREDEFVFDSCEKIGILYCEGVESLWKIRAHIDFFLLGNGFE